VKLDLSGIKYKMVFCWMMLPFALGLSTAQAGPIVCSPCLFYGGDPSGSATANEEDGIINQAAIYTPFVVPSGQTWMVTGLFTSNSLFTFNSVNTVAQSALWEVRTGISEYNGGTLLFSGTTFNPVVSDTGLYVLGEVYTVRVAGLSIQLGAGSYWLSVVPVCLDGTAVCDHRTLQADTNGLNAIGPAEPGNEVFLQSTWYGINFRNVNYFGGVYPAFSAGVIGTPVPEPSVPSMTGLCLLGMVLVVNRRTSKAAIINQALKPLRLP
jgi:hypothetical protein